MNGKRGTILSVADVAAHFGVTPQAVYKWCEAGKIEFERTPGGGYRIPGAQPFEDDSFDAAIAIISDQTTTGTTGRPKEEKELIRRGDELARKRRELPWVPVEKDYRFEIEDGTRALAARAPCTAGMSISTHSPDAAVSPATSPIAPP